MIRGVPYDAEIEWLSQQSVGYATQYIDTGISLTEGFKIRSKFRILSGGPYGVGRIFGTSSTFSPCAFLLDVGYMTFEISGNMTKSSFLSFPSVTVEPDTDIVIAIDSTRGTLVVNGAEVQIQNYTPYKYTASDGTFKLWSVNGPGDTGSCVVFYGVEIENGDGTNSNLIPVRVGNVGYMYDRVSRKLFGNAGTGAFVIGPDVARPVMGLRKFTPTARNYVQDGLVAMWDGIENAGWGVHDKNATEWVDLVGGNNMVAYSNALRWTEDSPFFVAWMRKTDMSLDVSHGFTLECCISNTAEQPKLGLMQRDSMTIGVSNGYMSTKALGAGPTSTWNGDGPTQIGFEWTFSAKSLEKLTTRCVGLGGTTMVFSYCDNLSPYSISYYPESGSRTFTIGGGSGGVEYGGVHNIRLYSRALTPAEISANYAIDKIRFNLP